MNKKLFLWSLCCSLLVFGCNSNLIYEERTSDFSAMRWQQTQNLTFTPDITNTDLAYKLFVALRHVNGFQFKTVNVNMKITSPSGKTDSKDYTLKIVGDNGQYLAECLGDLCDIDVLVEPSYKFEELGKYTFVISQTMDSVIPNVMEVGLIVEK